MNCEQWREIASDYVEGTLSSPVRAEASAHVSECVSCQRDVAALSGLARVLSGTPSVDAPLFFADNVRARLQAERAQRQSWLSWTSLGRVAFGTAIAGGAAAAVLWTLFLPRQHTENTSQAGLTSALTPESGALVATTPEVRVARTLRVDPDGAEPAYDFSFTLDGAESGTARVDVPGDSHAYRFSLERGVAQPLRVPLSVARGSGTIQLRLHFSAAGQSHDRYVIVPVPRSDAVMPVRLSFGLRDLALPEAARELSARFGRAVILDDPSSTQRVAFDARNETMAETLRRHLGPLGLNVSETADGLRVSSPPAPMPTPDTSAR